MTARRSLPALAAVATALVSTAVHGRDPPRRPRTDPLAATGAILLATGVGAIAGGAALHVFAKRAERRFDATFEQYGATGFSTLTWSDALVYRRTFERWATAAALSYAIAIIAIPVGAALVATGVTRKRARIVAAPSSRGVSLGLRMEF